MDRIHSFLAHAVTLEAEAARSFDELADAMQTCGNAEVEAFFRQMADYARLHLKEAMARAGFREQPQLSAEQFEWPDGEPPERPDWIGVDGFMDVDAALLLALASERRARHFYARIARTTEDPKIRAMAQEFAEEEDEHVALLEQWIRRSGASVPPEDE
ncbi:MAG: rubrerythrin [Candidatus Accumulibacter sp. 66-26]|nr:ferritin family protein [Accumulibacter sp.]OJW49703.1 MAG: rubrerythrin [Candidatus Accumulibacter sp. 66-26]